VGHIATKPLQLYVWISQDHSQSLVMVKCGHESRRAWDWEWLCCQRSAAVGPTDLPACLMKAVSSISFSSPLLHVLSMLVFLFGAFFSVWKLWHRPGSCHLLTTGACVQS
jgi:hypothetical protein